MIDDPGRVVRSRRSPRTDVPPGAVRRLDPGAATRLNLPHAVVVLVDGAWRHAWLLGHERDGETTSFLVQWLDGDPTEPVWIRDVELGQVDPPLRRGDGLRHGDGGADAPPSGVRAAGGPLRR
jgi:hypothetical protein